MDLVLFNPPGARAGEREMAIQRNLALALALDFQNLVVVGASPRSTGIEALKENLKTSLGIEADPNIIQKLDPTGVNKAELEGKSANPIARSGPKTVLPKCAILQSLSIELRYHIYNSLMPSMTHTIELTRTIRPRRSHSMVLTPLSQTCSQISNEMRSWYSGIKNIYNLTHTPRFGPLNLVLTTFTITINHAKWNRCKCQTISCIDNSFRPCTTPVCPRATLLSLNTWTPSEKSPIRNVKLFFLGEDEASNGNNDYTRVRQNQDACKCLFNLPALEEVEVFVGWPMKTVDLKRVGDWDLLKGEGRCWIPVGGRRGWLCDFVRGVDARGRDVGVRLWYAWCEGQEVVDGVLKVDAKLWRYWPRGGGRVERYVVTEENIHLQ